MSGILIRNGNVIDVLRRSITIRDILVKDGVIAPLGTDDGTEIEIDATGRYVSPGLIDGHLHIESSMLPPVEFCRQAVLRGTTSVFVDPHEITNVMGSKGIELFLDQAEHCPVDVNIGIPSCVPATDLETSGGRITADDIKRLLRNDRVYGLAEMMDVEGILTGKGDSREKVSLALEAGKIVDGHCPGLNGEDLASYISNGQSDWEVRIGSDHECTTVEEALEKWEKGMFLMLRHGSAAKDLENLLPGLLERGVNPDDMGLVSDDINAEDLIRKGHMDELVRITRDIIVSFTGMDEQKALIEALRMATCNTARYFRKRTGTLENGSRADIAIFSSPEDLRADSIIFKGQIVVDNNECIFPKVEYDYSVFDHPVLVASDHEEGLKVRSGGSRATVRIMSVTPGSIITLEEKAELPVEDGRVSIPGGEDISKIAVLERHGGTGNMAVGYVRGLYLEDGAIASTIAHDSHNLIVVGRSDSHMVEAVDMLMRGNGGLAAVSSSGRIYLPLSLGGLMFTGEARELVSNYVSLEKFVKGLGCDMDPFPEISFLALPVVPELKITDKGLVDVRKGEFVDLICK